ncbi:MAG TPA: cyanophycin synthetase [Candidatus Paceibacterota bacterium]
MPTSFPEILKKYKDAVAYVESFSNTSMRKNVGSSKRDPGFYLQRTRDFLARIGNPQSDLRVIHITGTAGKGSVSNGIHESLVRAGRNCGLFTSPFVTTPIEEIKVNDRYISPEDFARIVESLKPYIAEAATSELGAPSSFEIFLAVAFVYFKQQKCAWAVLEVGLGGRYDATNIVTKPVVTAITMIDYDHTEILGNTLGEIAFDKAGIVKKNSQFYTSEQRPSLRRLFKKICSEQGAEYHAIAHQSDYREYNRALVTAVCTDPAVGLTDVQVREGNAAARLPARFEIVAGNPLTIVDGAHNRSKILSTMHNVSRIEYKKLIAIVGISNTKKDTQAILEPVSKEADVVIVTSFGSGERVSVHPNAIVPLVDKYKKSGAQVLIAADPKSALALARKAASAEDCILITGSFFLAGLIRQEWFSEEYILKNRTSF